MPEASLADGLSEFSKTLHLNTASKEHGQIRELLGRARRYRLTPSAVASLDVVAEKSAWTIEHNLDAIDHPLDQPIWIEFEDAPRRRDGMVFEGREVDLIGYLVAPSPADPEAVVALVAWRLRSGSVNHAYGLVHWHRGDLVLHAANARHRYSRMSLQARARMMALFNVATPLRFKIMVQEMHAGEDPRLVEASLTDGRLASSGEMVFMFAALALLASDAPRSTGDDGFDVIDAHHGRRSALARAGDRLLRRPVPSFRRGKRADSSTLVICV